MLSPETLNIETRNLGKYGVPENQFRESQSTQKDIQRTKEYREEQSIGEG
jgi:hypothetical protein